MRSTSEINKNNDYEWKFWANFEQQLDYKLIPRSKNKENDIYEILKKLETVRWY